MADPDPAPPRPERRPVSRELHGETFTDDYAWLRDRDDPAVLDHLEAEIAHTDAVLAPLAPLVDELFSEIKGRVQESDVSVPARRGPWEYYVRTEEGLAYPIHCRRPAGVGEGDGEQVVLDENALAEGQEYLALGGLAVSPDHRLAAYTVDTTGDERYTLRVRDLDTGDDLADVIDLVSYGLAWADDSASVFYTSPDEALRPWQVWRHRLGEEGRTDRLVAQEDDDRFYLSVWRSRDDRRIVISADSKVTSEVRLLDASDPDGPIRMVEPRRQDVEYAVEPAGDEVFVLTNDGAPGFRVVRAPADDPGRDRWEEVVAEDPDTRWDDLDAFGTHLVVLGRRHGLTVVRVVDRADGSTRELTFPEPVYEAGAGANPEYDQSFWRFGYTSPVTPASVFDEDLASGARTLRKQQPVLGGYDPDEYVAERTWAPSTDGASVPLSIVRRRDTPVDGTAPGVVYVYGAYEVTVPAGFSPARLSLLDRGVVWAHAHVRGGGELGRPWYEDGKLGRKQHTFDDTLAAADHLADGGWVDGGRLAVWGGSAGGLNVGAALNQRPDRFVAAVAAVPFVDVVNTMLDASLPLTAVEWEEWGDPRQPDAYRTMRAYSPYENVTPAAYPAVLATTGLNDPRVGYWEPAKWVARLREETTSDRPVLLKVELGAGHGGPTGRYDAWRDLAQEYAFVLWRLGVVAPGGAGS